MATISFYRPHQLYLREMLDKATKIANHARKGGKWFTSADVKEHGLPAMISTAILTEYKNASGVKEVLKAPLICPHRSITYDEPTNKFLVPCLDLVLENPSPYTFMKVHRICLDEKYYYTSLMIACPPYRELDQRCDICEYDDPFKPEDMIMNTDPGFDVNSIEIFNKPTEANP